MKQIFPPILPSKAPRNNGGWLASRVGILCHPTCGGSVRVACDMANAYSRAGVESIFFGEEFPYFLRDRDTRSSDVNHGGASQNVLNWHWPANKIQNLAMNVAEQVRNRGLDVLHFHYAAPFAHVTRVVKNCLKSETPVIVGTLHGTDITRYKTLPSARGKLARALGAVDRLTTVSHSYSRLAGSVFNLKQSPIVIPNPVDLGRFHPYSAPRKSGSRPRMLHVSNFRRVKNPMGVAEVFIRARRKFDLELWLVGDGGELPDVLERLQKAGVGNDVVTLGAITNVENVIRACDLLLMTSREESFCLALLEGMACGIPVLSTDVGGVMEVVRHGRTGFLFESGDWDTAARYASEILNDPKISARMSDAGPKDAKNYAADKIAVKYLELYNTCLYGRP
jgi:L-malate glycosyltransferase